MNNLKWEEVPSEIHSTNYHRTKIFGGWLVEACTGVSHVIEPLRLEDGWDWRISIIFVPDANHEWEL